MENLEKLRVPAAYTCMIQPHLYYLQTPASKNET